tara:strand:- start:611 stop:2050 length:1440 start_codon:yes stop_codon:yes gene_type:complete
MNKQHLDKIISLCKRKGFVFPNSEIYGGLKASYDYGPLGTELKKAISELWWKEMTQAHQNIVGLDSAIMVHPDVWEASGHIANFNDPMTDNKDNKKRYRIDDLLSQQKSKIIDVICSELNLENTNSDDIYNDIAQTLLSNGSKSDGLLEKAGVIDPHSGSIGKWTPAVQFNLMFKTDSGPSEKTGKNIYLRPETAQGIFINYLLVQNTMRLKVPFGIAQIGKAFRNEIVARNFIFRTREFEQMEMQYFVHPSEDEKNMDLWKQKRFDFYINHLGINAENLKFHQHNQDALAHYAKDAYDIEYNFPFGWGEVEGIHNRTDFDLKQHENLSGKNMTYFDTKSQEKYHPYIIETSTGLNRLFLMVLCEAYFEDTDNNRIVLRLPYELAPIKAVICPLVKKDGLPEKAMSLFNDLSQKFPCVYDEQGSIGKRYYRQDEAGTPFGITLDHDTLEDNSVTIRERDSMKQTRIPIDKIATFISENK